jgi:hypothetical protein
MVGLETENGAESSPAVVGPERRSWSTWRRVGSARALKTLGTPTRMEAVFTTPSEGRRRRSSGVQNRRLDAGGMPVASATHCQGNVDETSTPPHYSGGMPRSLESLRAEAHQNAEHAVQRRRLLFRLKRIDDALHVWVLRDLAHQPDDPSAFRTPTIPREGLEMLREIALQELMELEADGW